MKSYMLTYQPSVEINVSILNARCGASTAVELVEIADETDDIETNSITDVQPLRIEEVQEEAVATYDIGSDTQQLRMLPFQC